MSHERTDASHERTNVSHERTNVSHERTNVSHERTNVSHKRTNVSHARTDASRHLCLTPRRGPGQYRDGHAMPIHTSCPRNCDVLQVAFTPALRTAPGAYLHGPIHVTGQRLLPGPPSRLDRRLVNRFDSDWPLTIPRQQGTSQLGPPSRQRGGGATSPAAHAPPQPSPPLFLPWSWGPALARRCGRPPHCGPTAVLVRAFGWAVGWVGGVRGNGNKRKGNERKAR